MQRVAIFFIISLFILSGCVSGPQTTDDDQQTDSSEKKQTDEKDVYKLTAMGEYLDNGIEKINYGSISEGIEQLILVLAEKDAMKNP